MRPWRFIVGFFSKYVALLCLCLVEDWRVSENPQVLVYLECEVFT